MIDLIKNSKTKYGFTLGEALITLVIIGVIAALTIPAVLLNTEQNEYKSALRKALSALNQVIELNIALDGFGPIEATSMVTPTAEDTLFMLFKNRMNIITTSTNYTKGGTSNYAFFTADGMRYEFPTTPSLKGRTDVTFSNGNANCASNSDVEDDSGQKGYRPCLIIVDVNGDKKPNPLKDSTKGYKVPKADSTSRLLDVYPIMVTENAAVPFGVVAQRAMFNSK